MAQIPVKVGSQAPEFSLPDQDGIVRRLSDYRGKSVVVLFFYPKDYTPICTLESIAFRDTYQEFRKVDAEVIGISQDPPQSHASFCDTYKLPFRLLTDTGQQIREQYGAGSVLGELGSRVTYVIDKQGIVRSIYRSALRAKKHVHASLEVAATLHDTKLDFLHS